MKKPATAVNQSFGVQEKELHPETKKIIMIKKKQKDEQQEKDAEKQQTFGEDQAENNRSKVRFRSNLVSSTPAKKTRTPMPSILSPKKSILS